MRVLIIIILVAPQFLLAQEWSFIAGINSTPVNKKFNSGYNIGIYYMKHIKRQWNLGLGLTNDVFNINNMYVNNMYFPPSFPDPLLKRQYSIQNVASVPFGVHINMAQKRNEKLDLFLAIIVNNGIRVHSKNIRIYENGKQVSSDFLFKNGLLYQGGFNYGLEGRYYLKNNKVLGFGFYYRLNRLKLVQKDKWNTTNNLQFTLRYGINNISASNQ